MLNVKRYIATGSDNIYIPFYYDNSSKYFHCYSPFSKSVGFESIAEMILDRLYMRGKHPNVERLEGTMTLHLVTLKYVIRYTENRIPYYKRVGNIKWSELCIC